MTTMTEPLHLIGVASLTAAIAAKEITPSELLEAYLERIDELDGRLKAWSQIDREGIRAEAAAMTAEAARGELRGPLHGIPFGVKEQFAVGGVPTLEDWLAETHDIPAEDAVPVARLKAAGALLVGKQYMVGPPGPPPSRNPWNLEHTPGGTSSGTGAAVGAYMAPFSLSEQTYGSGIRPAAYCGVTGFKPTFGRVARTGMFTMAWSLDHVCVIAYTAADIVPVFAALAGRHESDPVSFEAPAPAGTLDPSLVRPPRLGIVRNFFPERTQPVMNAAIDSSAEKLRAAGAEVVDILLPDEFELAWAAHGIIGSVDGATLHARGQAEKLAKGEAITGMGGRRVGALVPAPYYLQSQRLKGHLLAQVGSLFGQVDALVMATAPTGAPKGMPTGDTTLLRPWSYLGNPALSIPCGFDEFGLPLGLQMVGPTLGDEQLLAVVPTNVAHRK